VVFKITYAGSNPAILVYMLNRDKTKFKLITDKSFFLFKSLRNTPFIYSKFNIINLFLFLNLFLNKPILLFTYIYKTFDFDLNRVIYKSNELVKFYQTTVASFYNINRYKHVACFTQKLYLKTIQIKNTKKKSKLLFYKLFILVKTHLLFFGKISHINQRTLSTNLKKNFNLYDSFYTDLHFYLNLNKFEMNRTALNFNKKFMIKFLLKKFYQKFYNYTNFSKFNTYKPITAGLIFENEEVTESDYTLPTDKVRSHKLYTKTMKISTALSNNSILSKKILSNSPFFNVLSIQPVSFLLNLLSNLKFLKFFLLNKQISLFLKHFYFYYKNFYFANFSVNNLLPANNFFFVIKKKNCKNI
jgi:hypothetical protein